MSKSERAEIVESVHKIRVALCQAEPPPAPFIPIIDAVEVLVTRVLLDLNRIADAAERRPSEIP